MKSQKELTAETRILKNFGSLIVAYEEIAATRMRRVKGSVLKNRDFLEGLGDVYGLVREAYLAFLTGVPKNQVTKFKKLKTKDKMVSVFLSANTGLYGDIIRKTFDYFIKDTRDKDTDLVIVGLLGKRMIDDMPILGKRPEYTFFDLSDKGEFAEQFNKLLNHTLQYNEIAIYHGIFKDIVAQLATKTLVTGDLSAADSTEVHEPGYKEKRKHAIFEPSIVEVEEFFEKQLLAIVLEQTVNESSLSKFASRMINLEKAVDNVNSELTKTKFELLKKRHALFNSRQSNILSSITLWNR